MNTSPDAAMPRQAAVHCSGLSSSVQADARVLILGSMPGAASLGARQYYAHPRNQFWAIAGRALGFDPTLPYDARLDALRERGVGLWDVLRECQRAGSLDSSIRRASERPIDLAALLRDCPRIHTILLNGAKAAEAFQRHFGTLFTACAAPPTVRTLPSTSPANVAMPSAQREALWHRALMEGLARDAAAERLYTEEAPAHVNATAAPPLIRSNVISSPSERASTAHSHQTQR